MFFCFFIFGCLLLPEIFSFCPKNNGFTRLWWLEPPNPLACMCIIKTNTNSRQMSLDNNNNNAPQKAPLCGISWLRSIVLIWSRVLMSGERPPWTHRIHSLIICTHRYRQTDTQLVKRLSVNRLPVKLPITGLNFQLPITDLPTFFFTSCNFRLQLRLHWAQTYRRRRTARSNGSYAKPAFDCRVCSSPLPASGRRSRERWGRGRGANWTAAVDYKDWSSACH